MEKPNNAAAVINTCLLYTSYGCNGFVVHHNVDLWGKTDPADGQARWAVWPMAAVWICSNLYDHYRFTMDRDYPVSYTHLDVYKRQPPSSLVISGVRDMPLCPYSVPKVSVVPVV